MDWKEFLKPTWVKMFVFLITAFLSIPIIEILVHGCPGEAGMCSAWLYWPAFWITWLLGLFFYLIGVNHANSLYDLIYFAALLIVGVAISYPLACLLTYIYSKSAKGKTRAC